MHFVRTIYAVLPHKKFRLRTGAGNGKTANDSNSKVTGNGARCGVARAGSAWRFLAFEASAWHKRSESPTGITAKRIDQEDDVPGEEQGKTQAAHELDELIELTGEQQNGAVSSSVAGAPEKDHPWGISSETSWDVEQDNRPFAEHGWGTSDNQDSAESHGGHYRLNPLSIATSDVDSQQGNKVWLHVYDIGPLALRLNQMVLRHANLGAFHCGIEVFGDEWSFSGVYEAWDDPTICGVRRNEPKRDPFFLYRESMMLGHTPVSDDAIEDIIFTLREEWPANSYHPVLRNCVTFAEAFAQVLQAPEPFPSWVRGAADACKEPPLEGITECGWSCFKWWVQGRAEASAEMQVAAGQRI